MAKIRGCWTVLGILAMVAMTWAIISPQAASAGELEYQICVRRLCSNGQDQVICARACLEDLNGPPKYAPLPPIPTLWGAIALDEGTLATGFGKDYPSRADAERRALALCRRAGGSAAGCKVIEAQHNSCIALATSRSENAWGEAYTDDGWVARRDAVKRCRSEGGSSCKVVVSICTG
jgi:hypothetical protein